MVQRHQSSPSFGLYDLQVNLFEWRHMMLASIIEILKPHKEKGTFIVSLFISVQIPSNFVCTYDIYIKNTKLYIHNRFFLFLLWCLKIKMHSWKQDEFWYIIEYCSMLFLSELPGSIYGAHWQNKNSKNAQMLMAHCFQNNQVSSKTYLCSNSVGQNTCYWIMSTNVMTV